MADEKNKAEEEERSEDDIVHQTPIVVILGGKEHKIAPLVIRDSREWRKRVIALIAPLPRMVKVDTDDPDGFEAVLNNMMVTMPDQVVDLFFVYAKDLNRDEIEGVATDAEMSAAFEAVVKTAFPLAESLPNVMGRLSR